MSPFEYDYTDPAGALTAIERTLESNKILVADRVTQIETWVPELVDALVQYFLMAHLAERNMILRNGRTAKQIWDSAGLPGGIKGSAKWFGNRLSEMGCGTGNGKRGSKLVRLFDPDKAALCLRNGFLQTARSYADERRRKGRSHLRLV